MSLKAVIIFALSLFVANDCFPQKYDMSIFQQGLRGRIVEVPNKPIKLDQLSSRRNKIWKHWKQSVHAHYGTQISEKQLLNPSTQTWNLEGEDPLPYIIIKRSFKPAEGFPLFVNLHGSGPKKEEWMATQELSREYKGSPSLYFVPQIPSEKRYRWGLVPMQLAYEKLLRLAMVSDQIDRNKLYIMGISEGGYGSQRLGAFYADYWAGVGPMAGGEPLENAPVLNFRNTAFAMETGENDTGFGRNVYTQHARLAFRDMREQYPTDFVHRVNFQAQRAHSINYTLVSPWLIQQVRSPLPKHVSWVNFPLYGRYRQGFYNLAVEEDLDVHPDSSVDRTVFDLVIDSINNVVTLSAVSWDKENSEALPLKRGKLAIYLSETHLDLTKPVVLNVNGKEMFRGIVPLDEANLWRSCLLFGDPDRLFPAKLVVDFLKI